MKSPDSVHIWAGLHMTMTPWLSEKKNSEEEEEWTIIWIIMRLEHSWENLLTMTKGRGGALFLKDFQKGVKLCVLAEYNFSHMSQCLAPFDKIIDWWLLPKLQPQKGYLSNIKPNPNLEYEINIFIRATSHQPAKYFQMLVLVVIHMS